MKRSRLVAVLLAVSTASPPAFAQSSPAAAPASAAPKDAPVSLDERKKEARTHFERGQKLVEEQAWEAALAEFLRSREVYPTRGNTQNAAVCLRKMHRFDEALDLLEKFDQDFKDAPPQDRAAVDAEVKSLRALVGTIDVRVSEPGAAVRIDEKERGASPLPGPVRVSAGSHLVRVFKEGFLPSEQRVDVPGEGSVVVEAKLAALTQSGRLKIIETSGKAVDVLVDGIGVGKTPWQGPLPPGEHTVSLKGEGTLGTQPASAPVRLNETTSLSLALEELDTRLRVEPEPVSATVAIDGVAVGRGLWQGRLRAGGHRVEVAAEGFLPARKELLLASGEKEVIKTTLERDPTSPLWAAQTRPRVTFDLHVGVLLAPSLGGDLAAQCTGGCAASFPAGVLAIFRGGYQLRGGLGVGLEAGYASLSQSITNRSVAVTPVGKPAIAGTANDSLALQGFLFGVGAAFHKGETWPFVAGLGAGMLLGTGYDLREPTLAGAPDAPRMSEKPGAQYFYLKPEIKISRRFFDHLEVGVGVDLLVLVALSQPKWTDKAGGFNVAGSGLTLYGEQTMTGGVVLAFSPGLTLRYDL